MTRSRAEFLAGLPRKVVGSGALVTNADGHVLLVKPTYKPGWEIPGGVVEAGESAREACQRELAEELAVTPVIGRLLVVHHQVKDEGDSIMFVYDGGSLPDVDGLTLPASELEEARFVAPAQLGDFLSPRMTLRMVAALRARSDQAVEELVNDVPGDRA